MTPAFDPLHLRRAFGRFATGVTVVTSVGPDGRLIGVTVNSFASVSMTPPLVSWNYRREALAFAALAGAPHFAVHVLGRHQRQLSSQFASNAADRFAGVEVSRGIGNVPVITGCAAVFECRQWSTVEAGDHAIILGEVLRYAHDDAPPLVFHGGDYLTWPEATAA